MTPSTSSVQMSDSHWHWNEPSKAPTPFALLVPMMALLLVALNLMLLLAALTVEVLRANGA